MFLPFNINECYEYHSGGCPLSKIVIKTVAVPVYIAISLCNILTMKSCLVSAIKFLYDYDM